MGEERGGERLQLRAACTLIPMPEARILMRSSGVTMVLHGAGASELLPMLLPLLDGTRTAAGIVSALPGFAESDVHKVLEVLSTAGLIHDADDGGRPLASATQYLDQVRFFSGYGLGRTDEAHRRLQDASLGVLGLGNTGRELVRQFSGAGPRHLRAAGLSDGNEEDLGVTVVQMDIDADEEALAAFTDGLSLLAVDGGQCTAAVLERLNRVALRSGLPWIVTFDDGLSASIGPLFLPGETACFACYRARRRGTEDFVAGHDAWEAARGPAVTAGLGTLPGVAALVAGLTTVESIKLVTGFDIPAVLGAELVYDLVTGRIESHRVLKLPRCTACGPARLHRPEPALWMSAMP